MGLRKVSLAGALRLTAFLLFAPLVVWPQAAPTPSRIVDKVDDNAVVTLRGNTHPLAQRQFDRGIAPPDLPMARMLLVLKRSDAQETALQKLLDDQQSQSSPSYHQWLTPDQFGQQFGPSDQDVQTIAGWLRSHGFQIGMIGRGRTVIEFSGTAAQVQQALHTEIHKFTVNGQDHWANASDPQIPAALAPVIVGVASLHNFPKQPQYQVAGKFSRDNATGKVQPLTSEFTIKDSSICSGTNNCYFVGPYDFAKIYNVSPLWTSNPPIDGTGESIAIVSESNINLQDVRDFRSLFGLPAKDPEVFLNGPDPGLVQGPETEALLDVEWSGAVAKGATIKLVVSPPTNSTEGADLAGLYAVENNLAPIISESWGDCELFLGAAGNAFENAIREQAAAQGITYINSGGDEGSARCDPAQNAPSPATHGLSVSGLASSPYGVAVGGTDFLNFGPNYNHGSPSPYWSPSNDSHQASALGYVPEVVWNDNCTNTVFVVLGYGTTGEASCNNSNASRWIRTVAGGGGMSSCTNNSDQTNQSSCSSGYAKPTWQAGPGVPGDGARDIPDVSLFSGAGFLDSSYIVCESDALPTPQSCSLGTPFTTFLGIGGTSGAAPSFAGIMALVNQYTHSSGQGNANYVLYRLASSSLQTSKSCGATSSPSPACIFYDVISGANTVPCANGTPDCVTTTAGDAYGMLPDYDAGPGYDQASGLGSVNAYNLVHAWSLPPNKTSVTLALSPTSSTHGQSVNYTITVTPSAATGDVSLIGAPSPPGSVGMAGFTLQNGVASGTTTALAGGNSYQVTAHYAGDTNYQPSDSTPVTVTVAAEASKPVIWVSDRFNPVVFDNPATIAYGTSLTGFVGVGNAQATATLPPQPPCTPLTCPTGAVTVSDTLNGASPTVLTPTNGFPLDIEGQSQTFVFSPLGGQHTITASYAGDKSYLTGSGTYPLTVTPVFTAMNAQSPVTLIAGSNATLSANVSTYLAGSGFSAVAPTGTITFTDGPTPVPGTVTYSSQGGYSPNITGSISDTITTTGTHQITMSYSGDANYAPSSNTTTLAVYYATTTTENANPMTINDGQSVTVTAVATSAAKSPAMTGNFQFTGSPFFNPAIITPILSTDASGNQVLTATATVTPQTYGSQNIYASYLGDSNFQPGNFQLTINVNPPDFTIGTSAPSLPVTIVAGNTGTATVTLTPTTALQSSVQLSCNPLPIVGGQCSFNPTSFLNLSSGTSATTMVSISTLPASSTTTTNSLPTRAPEARRFPPSGAIPIVLDGLAILLLSLWSGRRYRRLAASVGMLCLLLLAIGCGTSGAGGGGLTPTSLTLSTASTRVASGGALTMSVTVSPSTATGTIALSDQSGVLTTTSVANGRAQIQLANLAVGTHVISAQYSGDANDLASQTGGSLSVVVTGTVTATIQGTTGALAHNASLAVTIQ